MSEPLVTCLCLTMAGRKKFLERAIDCFWRQTYVNKELLIVADSSDDVPQSGEMPPNVSILVPSRKMNIGEKRNLGCESAQGEIIAIWDDDDVPSRYRIVTQVYYLQASSESVTGTKEMLFTDGVSWWKFRYPKGFAAGTSLCFRRNWWKNHPFDETILIGEDTRFVTEAFEDFAFVYTPFVELMVENMHPARGKKLRDVELMYATIHPGNTSKKRTSEPGWQHLPGFEWKD